MKYKNSFGIILLFFFCLLLNTDNALAAKADLHSSKAIKVKVTPSNNFDWNSGMNHEGWSNDLFAVDGAAAYCADAEVNFNSGDGFVKYNGGGFDSSAMWLKDRYRLRTQDDAKELLRKMAVYDYFIQKNKFKRELSDIQKRAYTQVFVWKLIQENYATSPYSNFYIEEPYFAEAYLEAGDYYKKYKNRFPKVSANVWIKTGAQALITFSTKEINNQTSYSIDAACVDCDNGDENNDRASYIVQDTSDWGGILRSDDSSFSCEGAGNSEKNLSKYYLSTTKCGDKKIYCREEIHITFPNKKNKLTAEIGRYFTIHSPFRDPNNNNEVKKPYGPDYEDDVALLNANRYDHNWGPVKVKQIRQCRMNNNQADRQCLNDKSSELAFKNNDEDQLKLMVTYEGKGKNGKNVKSTVLEAENKDEFGSGTTDITKEIKSKVYNSKDGGVNSYNLYETTKVTTYRLPKNYNRYILKGSAKFSSDVTTRTNGDYIDLGIGTIPVSLTNKIGENAAKLSLNFTIPASMNLSKSFNKDNKYLPNCNSDIESNIYRHVNSKGISNIESGRVDEFLNSACSKLHKCKQNGNKISCEKVGIESCVRNRVSNKIGDCFTQNQIGDSGHSGYECPLNIVENDSPIDPPTDPNPGPGQDPNPGPGQDPPQTPCLNEIFPNWPTNCLLPAGRKVIYRPIDLDTIAFPGINSSGRRTGSNWCGYNKMERKWTCDFDKDNPIPEKFIYQNRNVRGSNVYSLNPIQTVKLDRGKIVSIMGYNERHSYDDYTLQCIKNGQECDIGTAFKGIIGQ